MPTPPRIALMLPRFSRYGGVEQFGWRLAGALAAKGYAVDFICARAEADPPPGVRVVAVGRPPGPKALKLLWFMLRAEQARKKGDYDLSIGLGKTWNQDITRVGGGPLQVFWRLSEEAWPEGAARTGKKLARLLDPAGWLTILAEKRQFRRSRHVIAISDTLRGWILEEYPELAGEKGRERAGAPLPGAGTPAPGPESGASAGADASTSGPGTGAEGGTRPPRPLLHTIYNCPDVSRFAPPVKEQRQAARERFGMEPGEYSLGLATTNFRLKGLDPLIRALPLLPEDTRLHVAGGRGSSPYRRLAESLGVGNRVRFHGKVADMAAFYHALDMFVLPTFYDTLGNVVLEALGSGLKTLCSSRAGAAAFLPPEQVLAHPGDSGEIAEKVRLLRASDAPVRFEPKGAGVDDIVALAEAELASRGFAPARTGASAGSI